MGQITVASDEQAIGIEQINQSLVHMDSVTQQNASMVDKAANTSRTMSNQATMLTNQLGYFTFSGSSNGLDSSSLKEQPAPGESVPAGLNKADMFSNESSGSSEIQKPVLSNEQAATTSPPLKMASGDGDFWNDF
jgi:methyl-accepting chemotaxis protein